MVRIEQHATPSSASKPDTSVRELVQVRTHHKNKSFYRAPLKRKNPSRIVQVLQTIVQSKLSDAMNQLAVIEDCSSEILMKSAVQRTSLHLSSLLD